MKENKRRAEEQEYLGRDEKKGGGKEGGLHKGEKRRAEEQEYLSREALMFYLVLMSPKNRKQ